jgi:hypothetical protein
LCARGTIIFSQSLDWKLTADVTAGPWKGRKMKLGSNKEVAILQGHRRKRDLFEGLAGNFPNKQKLSTYKQNTSSKRKRETQTKLNMS